MTTVYNISDFDTIKNDGFNYSMPDITLRLINKIANMVGSPNYIKTPVFKKKHTYIPKKADGTQDVFHHTKQDSKQNHNGKKHGKNRRRNKNKAKEITDEEWEIFRTFEKTTIKQKDNNFDIQHPPSLLIIPHHELNGNNALLHSIVYSMADGQKHQLVPALQELTHHHGDSDVISLIFCHHHSDNALEQLRN